MMRYDLPDASAGDLAASTMRLAAAEGLDLHSILIRRGGETLGEAYAPPFDAQTPHRMYSVTKSFVSTAVGLAISEGRLTLDDRVAELFADFVPAGPGGMRGDITIRHLLTMSSGHLQPPFGLLARPSPTRAGFLAEIPAVPPGSRFEYSNFCSYMLAAAVERATGEPLAEYLRPRLFEPLRIAPPYWVRTEEGVTNGGWGLHLTTRELARFGQLYLDRGVWEGRQLVPAAWIEEATGKRIESWNRAGMHDWHLGYGYQFWRGSHSSYRMDGLLGQFCVVFPELDAFVVTTAGTLRTQRLLDMIWEQIVPVLGGAAQQAPPAAAAPPSRAATSPRMKDIAGKPFRFGEALVLPTRLYGGQSPIVSFAVEADGEGLALVAADSRASYGLAAGISDWADGVTAFCTGYPEPYRARGGWESATRLAIDLVFTEAGFRMTLAFEAEPAQLALTLPANPGLEQRVVIGRPFP